MKLYRVTAAYDIYVYTNTEKEAERIAVRSLNTHINCCGDPDIITAPVSNIISVEPDWRNSIPFGDLDKDITIAELLKHEQSVTEQLEPNMEIEDDE